MNIYLVIFITLIAALIASFSQFLYKKGLKTKIRGAGDVLRLFWNRTIQTGLVGYLISLVVYLFALSEAPLSVVYPVFASTFIFITIISVWKLKEKLSLKRSLGVIMIFLGIVIIATTV